MKRKKEKYLIRFSQLIQEVKKEDRSFSYTNNKTIILVWFKEQPVIGIIEEDGKGSVSNTYFENQYKIPLPILIILITKLG